jgi:endo-1,4-beta-xylanase
MDLAVKYSDSISAVVIWGTTDDQSWRSSRLPVLFNEDYTAKPCYYSIIDGLTDDTDTTTTTTTTTTEETTEATTTTTEEVTDGTTHGADSGEFECVITEITDTEIITTAGTYDISLYRGDVALSVGDTVNVYMDLGTVLSVELVNSVNGDTYSVGDINKDGEVNASDLVLLKKYLLGITDTIDSELADMNSNGEVDVVDLLLLKKVILGIAY